MNWNMNKLWLTAGNLDITVRCILFEHIHPPSKNMEIAFRNSYRECIHDIVFDSLFHKCYICILRRNS